MALDRNVVSFKSELLRLDWVSKLTLVISVQSALYHCDITSLYFGMRCLLLIVFVGGTQSTYLWRFIKVLSI